MSVLSLIIQPIVQLKGEIIDQSAVRGLNCLDKLIWLVIPGPDHTTTVAMVMRMTTLYGAAVIKNMLRFKSTAKNEAN